jgi:hypothetical protein
MFLRHLKNAIYFKKEFLKKKLLKGIGKGVRKYRKGVEQI